MKMVAFITFSMFINKLEGLYESKNLINRATDGQIIDGYVPNDTIVINDEKATKCHTRVFQQYIIFTRNLLLVVSQERVIQATQTTSLDVRNVRVS